MSVNQFANILRALHFFDDLQGYLTGAVGKIQKIRLVYDHLKAKFKEVFIPIRMW